MRKKSKSVEVGKLNTRLWLIAGDDDLRPALSLACCKDGYVYVTDAHVAVKQSLSKFHNLSPEHVANLNGKFIHKDVLKELDKFQIVSYEADYITAKKEVGKNMMTVKFNYNECDNYPNVEKVINEAINRDKGKEMVNQISFNPKLLNRLYDAMKPRLYGFGGTALIFDFVSGYGAIGVKLNTSDYPKNENFGIIMSCMINS